MTPRDAPARAPLRLALGLSLLLLSLRLYLSERVGFGDSEALYVSYGLHPAPAFLDHPGLVGELARWIGDGSVPRPSTLHQVTALAATAVPWVGYAAARALGAASGPALRTFFALALWPEMSLGLFALTPDLPLAVLWLGALGAAGAALRSPPESRGALLFALAAGLSAGLAVTAKASGALLVLALAATLVLPANRARLKTAAPWLAAALVAVLVLPLALHEVREGFPLLRHRFVTTQSRAGLSLRNLAALLGGQLAYVGPPLLVGAYRVLRVLLRDRGSAVPALLVAATVVPGLPLAGLCLWSRVAEPHWLAPAYLGLALGASLHDPVGPWVRRAVAAFGSVAIAAGFLLVATPVQIRILGSRYVPRYDLANDLFAWKTGIPLVREELEAAAEQSRQAVVVGPHWTVCAQLHAGLGASVQVGCRTPGGDDFSTWLPESGWRRAPTVLFVTDDRFDVDAKAAFPDRDVVGVRTGYVYRGGRPVRAIHVTRLDRAAVTRLP